MYYVKTKTGYYGRVKVRTSYSNLVLPLQHRKIRTYSRSMDVSSKLIELWFDSLEELNYHLDQTETKTEKEPNMQKLYEVKQDDEAQAVYGHKLAVNSEGLWVIEVKGGGVIAVPQDRCKEVIPHSILVSFHYSRNKIHMLAEKGKYEEGSYYFVNNSDGFCIAKVEKVNTEHPAKETFKPFAKVNVEKLENN